MPRHSITLAVVVAVALCGILATTRSRPPRPTATTTARVIEWRGMGPRYLLQVEEKKPTRRSWTMMVTMAGQRKGVPFVRGKPFEECIITGGIATISVKHKGKTYAVC